jgi:hypothetical protein
MKQHRWLLALCGVAALAWATPALADESVSAEDVVPLGPQQILGRALANRYELDARASVEVTVVSRTGGRDARRAEVASKLVDGQILSYGRFTYPEDMRDMAVLRLEYADRGDDFWAYLPEFRKVRRLSASQKTDLFIGTDAAFEDVERRMLGDYNASLEPSATLDGEDVFVVRAEPTYESGYAFVEYSIAKSDFSILRTRHFKDGEEKPFKVITAPRATTELHGGHTIPMEALVQNLERGTSTELKVLRIVVGPELDDKLFTTRSLTLERRLPDYDDLVVQEP